MIRHFAALALACTLFLPGARAAEEAKGAVKPAAEPAEPQISVKGAKGEEATKAKLRADALLARCTIKPVMTDDEIAVCKSAYKATDLAQKQK